MLLELCGCSGEQSPVSPHLEEKKRNAPPWRQLVVATQFNSTDGGDRNPVYNILTPLSRYRTKYTVIVDINGGDVCIRRMYALQCSAYCIV